MYGVILSIYILCTLYILQSYSMYTVHFSLILCTLYILQSYSIYISIFIWILYKDYPWNIKSDCFKEKQQSQNFLNKSFFISQAQLLSIFFSAPQFSRPLLFLPLSLSLSIYNSLFLSLLLYLLSLCFSLFSLSFFLLLSISRPPPLSQYP